MILKYLNKALAKIGYKLTKDIIPIAPDIASEKEFMSYYSQCRDYTMTSIERMFALYQALLYIQKNNIKGDFVECGVWKGGSSMMIATFLAAYGMVDRKIYLFDTFEGMSEPDENDKTLEGTDASVLLNSQSRDETSSIWCYSSLEEVKGNLFKTQFPRHNIHFIQGKVEDTLSKQPLGNLALLRLDTDWYESTKVELEQLYPRLSEKGVLIVDDFGHWQGAKKAVVEYFNKQTEFPFIQRIDYTGRLIIK